MGRYSLKSRTVLDVIDSRIVEESNGELDGAIITFRGEEEVAAQQHIAQLEANDAEREAAEAEAAAVESAAESEG